MEEEYADVDTEMVKKKEEEEDGGRRRKRRRIWLLGCFLFVGSRNCFSWGGGCNWIGGVLRDRERRTGVSGGWKMGVDGEIAGRFGNWEGGGKYGLFVLRDAVVSGKLGGKLTALR